MKYVPCNTVEKLCPLPRCQRGLRRPPSPRRCWEAAGLSEGFGCAPCTSSVFLAPAPPDCGPAHTIVRNKTPVVPQPEARSPPQPGQGLCAARGSGTGLGSGG